MKYLITVVFSILFLITNLSGQSQLEVEAPSSEVVKVKSTTGVTTTITLENDGDLPVGGAINNRRGYLETRANDVIVGASSNNTGGDIILKLPATSLGRIMLATNTANHVVMRSNGDFGIGTDTPSKKLDVDGEVRVRDDLSADQFINLSSQGLKFANNEEVNDLVPLYYAICYEGTFPLLPSSSNPAATGPIIGEIRLFANPSFIPKGWLKCDGSILNISEYTSLFGVLGSTYGGDGRDTFGVPDLRKALPIQRI